MICFTIKILRIETSLLLQSSGLVSRHGDANCCTSPRVPSTRAMFGQEVRSDSLQPLPAGVEHALYLQAELHLFTGEMSDQNPWPRLGRSGGLVLLSGLCWVLGCALLHFARIRVWVRDCQDPLGWPALSTRPGWWNLLPGRLAAARKLLKLLVPRHM